MDPLMSMMALLKPRMVEAKMIAGAGRWAIRYDATRSAGFGLVLSGEAWLAVAGAAPVRLRAGDFVLIPLGAGFVMASDLELEPRLIDPDGVSGLAELRHGDPTLEPTFRILGGYFAVEAANVVLLDGLLPAMVHVTASDPAAQRLNGVTELIAEELGDRRPGRDLIVERLVEVLLVEALRYRPEGLAAPAGLLAGIADPHVARALRCIHADAARRWTVAELAREAGLSRSGFSERFAGKVGLPPMEYLIQWRMALARDLLQRRDIPLEEAAAAIGYESASAFSTAFRKQVGLPPSHYARSLRTNPSETPASR